MSKISSSFIPSSICLPFKYNFWLIILLFLSALLFVTSRKTYKYSLKSSKPYCTKFAAHSLSFTHSPRRSSWNSTLVFLKQYPLKISSGSSNAAFSFISRKTCSIDLIVGSLSLINTRTLLWNNFFSKSGTSIWSATF